MGKHAIHLLVPGQYFGRDLFKDSGKQDHNDNATPRIGVGSDVSGAQESTGKRQT